MEMKNGERKKLVKNTVMWCAAAFLTTGIVAMIGAGVKGLFPFGDQSVYFGDLAGEYSTFLTELWRKVHEGGSLFYSWKTGVGGSWIGVILFILSSPFNLFVLLGKESSIDEAITILIFFRQALSAAAMCGFLCLRRNGNASPSAAICGMLYGSCGWFCSFYYNDIWLDVFMLTPLMLLGIERIIDAGKPGLYFAVFTVMLFSNFYLSYISALFAIIYWLYYFFSFYRFRDPREAVDGKLSFFRSRFFRAGTIFAVSSVLSALCLSVVFLPFLLHMSRNAANEDAYSAAKLFTNLSQYVTVLFSGSKFFSINYSFCPPLYTGVLALAAVPLFFFQKNTSRREKLAIAILLLFMLLSFNLPVLDRIWHGFRLPTNLTFRESYVFSVILLMMMHRTLTGIRTMPPKAFVVLSAVAVLGATCAVWELKNRGDRVNVSIVSCIVTLVLFLAITGMLLLLRFGKSRQTTAVAMIFVYILCLFDCGYTLVGSIQTELSQKEIDDKKEQVCDLLGRVNDDSLFYRTELSFRWFNNDGAFFDYNGIRQSSSTATMPLLRLMKDFGMDSNENNCIYYDSQTPLFNSLFGVRYIVEQKDYAQQIGVSYLAGAGESYRLMEENDNYMLYRFGDALPLGFMADRSLTDWQPEALACPDNQASFYAAVAGSQENAVVYCDEDLDVSAVNPEEQEMTVAGVHRYSVKKTLAEGGSGAYPGVTLKGTAKMSGILYAYAETLSDQFTNVIVSVKDETNERNNTFKSNTRVLTDAVSTVTKGDSFEITFFSGQDLPCDLVIRLFQIDPDVLNRQYNAIEKHGYLALEEFSDTHFKGSVSTAEDGVLCLTVPYDPGWNISLDGEKLSEEDYELIGGALYGLPLTQGEHEVEFTYHLYGLGAGVAMSAFAVVGSVVFALVLRRRGFVPTAEEASDPEE